VEKRIPLPLRREGKNIPVSPEANETLHAGRGRQHPASPGL